MSHSKKKNFVIYELKHIRDWNKNVSGIVYTDTEKQFGLVPSHYTKEQLISRLAINKFYSTEEGCIVNNLKDNMTQTRPKLCSVKMNSVFGAGQYTTVDYKSVFFIGKLSNNEIEGINYEVIRNTVDKRVEKLRAKRKRRLNSYKKSTFKFRQGPVENVSHCKWHRGTYYRIPALHGIKVANCSYEEETKVFEKAKYRVKNLPVYDDRVRHIDKSWKTQHKIKKQWMKHLDTHVDSIRYIDKSTSTELEDSI